MLLAAGSVVWGGCGERSSPAAPSIPSPTPALSTLSQGPALQQPNAKAGLIFCEVAFRAPSGQYRKATVPVKLGKAAFDASSRTVLFGYRGWSDGIAEPIRLATCVIPDASVAIDAMKAVFAVKNEAAGRALAGKASASATEPMIVVDGVASATCDPTMLICDCPDTGCEDGGEWVGPPPTDPVVENALVPVPAGESAYAYDTNGNYVQILCWGQTDRPHVSTTTGYGGNVNVHARTWCPVPLSMSVWVTLQRHRCILFYCWWSTQAPPGYFPNVALKVETTSAAACKEGWWQGLGDHYVIFPSGNTGQAHTRNINYIQC